MNSSDWVNSTFLFNPPTGHLSSFHKCLHFTEIAATRLMVTSCFPGRTHRQMNGCFELSFVSDRPHQLSTDSRKNDRNYEYFKVLVQLLGPQNHQGIYLIKLIEYLIKLSVHSHNSQPEARQYSRMVPEANYN